MRSEWKPGNMLYPLPAVMISVGDILDKSNIITVAWAGNVCTNPPMVSISIRKSRYSYNIIKEKGEFVINLVTDSLIKACDYCGVVSGKDHDKFKEMNLHKLKLNGTNTPAIEESPVNILCKVESEIPLGSHNMFIARVTGVFVDDKYMDENNYFNLEKASLITYSHGTYYKLGDKLGKFGYSIKKVK